MKTIHRFTKSRQVLRRSIAKKFGQYETLENRQVMANDFLAGTAFIDDNNNGLLDFSESYLPDATIELRSADGATLYDTRITDAKVPTSLRTWHLAVTSSSIVPRPDYASSKAQVLSDISTFNGSTANSINVTLRSPANLQASVDMDEFVDLNAFEEVTVSIGTNSVTRKIGQLPVGLRETPGDTAPFAEFWTLSVDLFNGLGDGVNGPYAVNASNNPAGSGAPQNGQRIAYLYNHYGREQLNSIDAAGLQLAVWSCSTTLIAQIQMATW